MRFPRVVLVLPAAVLALLIAGCATPAPAPASESSALPSETGPAPAPTPTPTVDAAARVVLTVDQGVTVSVWSSASRAFVKVDGASGPREVPETSSLCRVDTVGVEYVEIGFAGDLVSRLSAPLNDFSDI